MAEDTFYQAGRPSTDCEVTAEGTPKDGTHSWQRVGLKALPSGVVYAPEHIVITAATPRTDDDTDWLVEFCAECSTVRSSNGDTGVYRA